VEPVDATVDATGDERPSERRRLVVAAVGIAVVAVVVALVMRWLRSDDARETVHELAEASAAALADVIVDELLPGT